MMELRTNQNKSELVWGGVCLALLALLHDNPILWGVIMIAGIVAIEWYWRDTK